MTYDKWSKCSHIHIFYTFLSQCQIYLKKKNFFLSQDFYCHNNNCHKQILTFVSVMKLLCNSASNAFQKTKQNMPN